MGAKLSNWMTALGLCSMAFYAVMTVSGFLPFSLMPHFLVSSAIFLMSGRVMRRAARAMVSRDVEEESRPKRPDADWPWLTGLLNWTFALLVVGIMAVLLMKPIGVSIEEAISFTVAPEQFYATAVP